MGRFDRLFGIDRHGPRDVDREPAPDHRQPPRSHRGDQTLSGERDLRRAAGPAGAQTMIASRRRWIRAALAAAAALGLAARLHAAVAGQGHLRARAADAAPGGEDAARTAAGGLRHRRRAVSRSRSSSSARADLKYETDYYHEFLVAPGANIGEATARALAAAKVFASVAPAGRRRRSRLGAGRLRRGALRRRAQHRQAGRRSDHHVLPAPRRATRGVPIWSRTYDRRVPFTTGSASAYVTRAERCAG